MDHSFLICCFPRSRSLWLSKFLTIPGYSFCSHEATEHAGSAEEFWSNAPPEIEVYGNSDSANIFVLPSILAERPMTKVIWIARPVQEVIQSMKSAGIPCTHDAMQTLVRLRDRNWNYVDTVFDYEALALESVCRMIWAICLPGLQFDRARWVSYHTRKICYSPDNPYPNKNYQKFLDWVKHDLTEEAEEYKMS